MKQISFIIGFLLIAIIPQAQTRFFSTVKIEFEKTVYVKQQYKEIQPEWYERIKDRLPDLALSYFDFVGDTTMSLYKPGREVTMDPRKRYDPIGDKNVVFTDFKNEKYIAQKPVFEETFLVEDSLARIKWKLTSDTRTIAGFECRKAIGILNDSIGVFAFYTDELMVRGGPESVHGLPGMILGMGIPRIHTTWFATKVEVNGVNTSSVKPATKGKKVTRQNMFQSLEKVMKEWGTYSKMFVNFLI